MTKVSIIILNYNDSDTTIGLVDNLKAWECSKFELNIVVVDNKSKDDSFIKLSDKYHGLGKISVIQSDYNGGYAYGNNYGTRFAIKSFQPNYIAIANPDIIIEEAVFEKIIQTLENEPAVSMIAPVPKDLNGNYSIASQRLPYYMDDLKACFNSSSKSTINSKSFEYFDAERTLLKTEMIVGCFFVIKSDVYQDINLLDENTFLFCEERILGKRMKDAGYQMAIRSDLFFVHAHGVSVQKTYSIVNTWKLIMKSRYYYEKQYNSCNLFQLILLRIAMLYFVQSLNLKLHLYQWKKQILSK